MSSKYYVVVQKRPACNDLLMTAATHEETQPVDADLSRPARGKYLLHRDRFYSLGTSPQQVKSLTSAAHGKEDTVVQLTSMTGVPRPGKFTLSAAHFTNDVLVGTRRRWQQARQLCRRDPEHPSLSYYLHNGDATSLSEHGVSVAPTAQVGSSTADIAAASAQRTRSLWLDLEMYTYGGYVHPLDPMVCGPPPTFVVNRKRKRTQLSEQHAGTGAVSPVPSPSLAHVVHEAMGSALQTLCGWGPLVSRVAGSASVWLTASGVCPRHRSSPSSAKAIAARRKAGVSTICVPAAALACVSPRPLQELFYCSVSTDSGRQCTAARQNTDPGC